MLDFIVSRAFNSSSTDFTGSIAFSTSTLRCAAFSRASFLISLYSSVEIFFNCFWSAFLRSWWFCSTLSALDYFVVLFILSPTIFRSSTPGLLFCCASSALSRAWSNGPFYIFILISADDFEFTLCLMSGFSGEARLELRLTIERLKSETSCLPKLAFAGSSWIFSSFFCMLSVWNNGFFCAYFFYSIAILTFSRRPYTVALRITFFTCLSICSSDNCCFFILCADVLINIYF